MRSYEGHGSCRLENAGFDPATVDAVAVSHLHYDHAGGVVRRMARLRFRGQFVAQLAEWEIAMGDNPRLTAGYDQPELKLFRDLAAGAVDGEAELLPGVLVFATGATAPDIRACSFTDGSDRGVLRGPVHAPWSANPRWVTSFDDFPLDSVAVKQTMFARAADEGWTIVLSHEPTILSAGWSATATASASNRGPRGAQSPATR